MPAGFLPTHKLTCEKACRQSRQIFFVWFLNIGHKYKHEGLIKQIKLYKLRKFKKWIIVQENGYIELLNNIKQNVIGIRIQAVRAVNSELISLYLSIGKLILEQQKEYGWWQTIVEKLSIDLQRKFPQKTGFSSRNICDMRIFYYQHQNEPKQEQVVAEIPLGQHLLIFNKIDDFDEAHYYLRATVGLVTSKKSLQHGRLSILPNLSNTYISVCTARNKRMTKLILY